MTAIHRILVALAALVWGTLAAAPPPAARDIAFVGVGVIPMTGAGLLPDRTVIVRDGRIVAVGLRADTEPGPGDRIIDARGLYLMPGLAEMHAHIPRAGGRGLPDGYREDVLSLWVAHGIVLVRGMLGHPSHLELRAAVERGAVLGPRIITSGPSFNGRSVSSPEQARRMARRQAAAGYDLLKMHPGLQPAELAAIAETAAELGMPFGGHVSAAVGLAATLDSGQGTIEHLDGYLEAMVPHLDGVPDAARTFFGLGLPRHADRSRMAGLVAHTLRSGAAVVPTETLLENAAQARRDLSVLMRRPQNVWLPPQLLDNYGRQLQRFARLDFDPEALERLRKELLLALHGGGVPVLLGADAPQIMNVPGASTHRELASYVAAGLSPREALATGTTNVAAHLGEVGRMGQIVPGAEGSLILLRANPLDDIDNSRSIEGVLLRGSWLGRARLDAMLDDIKARYAAAR